MTPDPFEQRLARQPLRPVPAEWRAEILPRAGVQPSAFSLQPSSWLDRFLGPNPLAWAGLAAVWAVLLVVSRGGNEPASSISSAARASQPSEIVVVEIVRERRREMAELLNLSLPETTLPARDALPPKRSQRRDETAMA